MRRIFLTATVVVFLVGLSAAPAYARSSRISIALNKRAVTYDSPALLTGQLQSSSGAALAGKTVYLLRGGKRVRTLTTDSRGRLSTFVNYRGLAVWRFSFPGTSRYSASLSPELSSYPVYVLNKTYWGLFDGYAYTTQRTLRFAKGHTYQVIFDHRAWYFLGTGETELTSDPSGTRRSFVFKPPWTTNYWCEWDWGGSVGPGDPTLNVIIW
jgi:hypothetical protein